MTHITDNRVAHRPARIGFKSVLQAVIRADKAFRDKQHLRDLPDYLLKDAGLRREDLDTL